MCGVVGIIGHEYVTQDVYDGLMTLQHRGQDAAGIISYDGSFHVRKDFGLVQNVFHTRHMKRLQGYAAVGHTRYATAGSGSVDEVQPFLGQSPFGVSFVQNGNLINAPELKKEIFEKDHRLVNSESDGEVLLNVFTKELSNQNADVITAQHVERAVANVYERARGAYSVVAYIARQGMVGFRDPKGIRPLILGKRGDGSTAEYIFASESSTLGILGFEVIGDVNAGEAVFIDERTREVHRMQITDRVKSPCAFEFVYFARPDSVIDGVSVYQSRLRMGHAIGKRIKEAGLQIDVVTPVPDSGRAAAFAVADELDLPYREVLVRNRYIGRTFIMPGQKVRKKSIRYKLNPMPFEIQGKNILLVDDSIVRGNTSRQIVDMVREAGAAHVYFASYAPPVMYPNVYGIDIPTREELVAVNQDIEDIRKELNADALFYGTVEDLFDAIVGEDQNLTELDMSCFDGVYKSGDVDKNTLIQMEALRTRERAMQAE